MEAILKSDKQIYSTSASVQADDTVEISVKENHFPENRFTSLIEDKQFTLLDRAVVADEAQFAVLKSNNKYYVKAYGDTFEFSQLEQIDLFDLIENPAEAAGGVVHPPMPGSVVAVLVSDGDSVKAGDKIMVIEAMKMETTLTADISGVVSKLELKEADRFDTDTILYSIEQSDTIEN